MNIFVRFGNWLEQRRVIRWTEWMAFRETNISTLEAMTGRINNLLAETEEVKAGVLGHISLTNSSIVRLDRQLEALEEKQQIPATLAKDLSIIRSRLDRVELIVGLKREPVAIKVPGSAAIS